jgi:NAD/NADP transhydrogenase alpha subunit
MDVLSSQANLAGYRAVIEGAEAFGRAFPMMMTAAGTGASLKTDELWPQMESVLGLIRLLTKAYEFIVGFDSLHPLQEGAQFAARDDVA